MTIYIHRIVNSLNEFLHNDLSFNPAYLPILINDHYVESVTQYALDPHEALKAIWNPATIEARQAVIDALPKIQVISVAGTIE
jgi:hypothetical protein